MLKVCMRQQSDRPIFQFCLTRDSWFSCFHKMCMGHCSCGLHTCTVYVSTNLIKCAVTGNRQFSCKLLRQPLLRKVSCFQNERAQ